MGNNTKNYETIMVSGYAPAPRGTAFQGLYGFLGVIMIVDVNSDIIVDVEFTFVTDVANSFFSQLLQGVDLKTDIDELSEVIRSKCWAPSTEALIACVKIARRRYFDTKKKYVAED